MFLQFRPIFNTIGSIFIQTTVQLLPSPQLSIHFHCRNFLNCPETMFLSPFQHHCALTLSSPSLSLRVGAHCKHVIKSRHRLTHSHTIKQALQTRFILLSSGSRVPSASPAMTTLTTQLHPTPLSTLNFVLPHLSFHL